MGSVQEHTNEAGPECFKCGQVNFGESFFGSNDDGRIFFVGLQGQLPFKLKVGKSFIGMIYLFAGLQGQLQPAESCSLSLLQDI